MAGTRRWQCGRWAGMAPVQDPAKTNQAIRQSTTGLGIRRYLRDP